MQNLDERVKNKFDLVKPGRELLKEGRMVNLLLREVPQPCQVILVTDSLLFANLKVLKGKNKLNNYFLFRMPLEDLK